MLLKQPHSSQACDVLLKFGEIDYTNNEQLGAAFQGVIQCLKDPELPVRVSAALSIPPFFRHKMIHEAMKPHVHTIMQELLNLTNEIDMDTLTHVMEQLVSDYSEQIAPFAVQLATQLRDTFLRIMGDANPEGEEPDYDEVENKTMAAMGVLKTLSSLIMAVEASNAILGELEVAIAPAVIYVLQNNVLGMFLCDKTHAYQIFTKKYLKSLKCRHFAPKRFRQSCGKCLISFTSPSRRMPLIISRIWNRH